MKPASSSQSQPRPAIADWVRRFGKAVRRARERRDLSQRALGRIYGVSYDFVRRLENGSNPEPGLGVCGRLAIGLGINLQKVLHGIQRESGETPVGCLCDGLRIHHEKPVRRLLAGEQERTLHIRALVRAGLPLREIPRLQLRDAEEIPATGAFILHGKARDYHFPKGQGAEAVRAVATWAWSGIGLPLDPSWPLVPRAPGDLRAVAYTHVWNAVNLGEPI